ncbi:MAG: hypothetical protein JSS81_04530 [Acidobacteria bacterium]|nr:hypothetical protein [Acidobacteriota bacterium]
MKTIIKKLRRYGELLSGVGFDVVARHPLADEAEWLEKLDLRPDDCDSCEIIRALGNKLVFVSFFSTAGTTKEAHVYYRFDREALFGGHHFHVATRKRPLTKKHIENGLEFLFRWLKDERRKKRKRPRPGMRRIFDEDVCKGTAG